MRKIWAILIWIIGICPAIIAQQDSVAVIPLDSSTVDVVVPEEKDTITVDEIETLKPYKHSPKKAMLLSALLPGSGQIYNKKYWKAPVVWTGFAVFGYFINQNNREYQRFRRAYNYNVDDDSTTISEFPNVSPNLLANERDIFRKWRDLSIILTVGWYALNIIDANVDAHLFEFDVSDVARVRWEPTFNMALNRPRSPLTGGLRLSLTF